MSYTRFDDENDGAYLTDLRERLSREVRAYTGRPFHIFQDTEDIKWGQPFEERIDTALATINFFIPILTPSFFTSRFCRYELEQFLAREAALGRNDLVLPVYYIRVPALERAHLRAHDPLAQTLAARQYIDWRRLRRRPFDLPEVHDRLAEMAEQIADALEQLPPPPPTLAPVTATPANNRATQHPSLPDMVKIPAGPFLMGSSDADKQAHDDEKPQHRLELPTYWIGRTPVTNVQFRPFVAGDGYRNRDYWTDAGWRWREEEGIVQPGYWDDPKWNGDDYPVVRISWFEAVAYCRWLEAQTGIPFRLPTEAEWEKAARGPDGLIWPWGNTWKEGRCNSEEAGIGRTTPVGSYPAGAGPYDVLDMAGNVWEWCVTKWQKDYPYQIEDEWTAEYLAGNDIRVLRGGAFWNESRLVRGAFRNVFSNPRSRNSTLNGVRLASHSPLPGSDE
jgi:formylglycine-generating enzyme required for sulfatase activity